MAAIVIKAFKHANTGRIWRAGAAFEGTDEQARELARRGYVRIDPEPEAEPEGEPEGKDPEDMTIAQLKALCDEYGIPAPSRAKKENLVAAVKLYEAEAGADSEAGDGAEEPEDE